MKIYIYIDNILPLKYNLVIHYEGEKKKEQEGDKFKKEFKHNEEYIIKYEDEKFQESVKNMFDGLSELIEETENNIDEFINKDLKK